MRLTQRLILHIMISLALVVVPVSLYQLYSLLKNSYQENYQAHLKILKSFTPPVAEALWSLDSNFMNQLTTSLLLAEEITRVEVYDQDLKIFTGVNKGPDLNLKADDKSSVLMSAANLNLLRMDPLAIYREEREGPYVRIAIPIIWEQRQQPKPSFQGVLAIEYSLRTINQKIIFRILQNTMIILLLIGMVSFVLFYFLKKSVVNPLFDLIQAMQIMPSDRSVRMSLKDSDTAEFTLIFETFNNMVASLQAKENVINEQRKQMIQSSKMSALGEIAAGVAHEINNPLAIIVGYNHIARELINRGELKKSEIIKYLDKIQITTDRISKIIQALKTFSRNSIGDARKWVPLQQMIENTFEFCNQRFKNHGIELTLETVPPVEIFCRESQIIQVLLNLMNNSFDAVQENNENLWIRMSFSQSKNLLLLQITDSGAVISDEIVEKMMQPFFTTKEVGKGTGLGLSISKGIIDEHGGQLRFNKQSLQTQFVIEFPGHLFRKIENAHL